jgi:hypothetical protein
MHVDVHDILAEVWRITEPVIAAMGEAGIRHPDGWTVEAYARSTYRHPWFGDLSDWDQVSRWIWLPSRELAETIARALAKWGLKAFLWQDGGGPESRAEFAPGA